jgi:hypothetical protein
MLEDLRDMGQPYKPASKKKMAGDAALYLAKESAKEVVSSCNIL